MQVIIYYEGNDSVINWVKALLAPLEHLVFKKLPSSNNSTEFTELPAYIADILFLDKPDLILSACTDGIHEKPLFSIEFASCTPQFQHALQRFPRMLASVSNRCPSMIFLPKKKCENSGNRVYQRSSAVEYAAVRLLDVYDVPSFVLDWPDVDGNLSIEDGYPPITCDGSQLARRILKVAINACSQVDYIGALRRSMRWTPKFGPVAESSDFRLERFGNSTPDTPIPSESKT